MNPKVAYLDTSVLVALMLEERLRESVLEVLSRFRKPVSHHLAEAELLSVCSREQVSIDTGLTAISRVEIVYPRAQLSEQFQEILTRGYVREADLLHLGCALWLAGKTLEHLGFLSLDKKQSAIATKLGFYCPLAEL